jgi:hypothetical protein
MYQYIIIAVQYPSSEFSWIVMICAAIIAGSIRAHLDWLKERG